MDLAELTITELRGAPRAALRGVSRCWEWRVFARNQIACNDALLLRDGDPEPPETETYLLSADSPHSVKVRSRHVEVSELAATSETGLALWRPTLRAAFPLRWAELDRIFLALALREFAPTTPVTCLDDLERRVMAGRPSLRSVTVTQRRTRVTSLACVGELVDLTIAGERWQSIAFEHPDPEQIRLAIASLELGHLRPMNYPAALKRIIGWPALPVRERMR
jgi:hypothetical protein